METDKTRPPMMLSRRRALSLPGAAVLAGVLGPTLLAACGGGGDAGAPVGGAAGFMAGPISGLGSIIVGGVRFDDSSARVESEDDDDSRSRNRSELQLGMMVEVQSSSIDDNSNSSSATLIRFGSEMKGRVDAIDAGAQTLRVLDQTVEVRSGTVFGPGLADFAAIQAGQILEIHAQFDAGTGRYSATRIDLEDSTSEFRLRGVVSAHDATAKTFRIGDAVINYASARVDQAPADGVRIRVRLQTAKVNDQWVATRLGRGRRSMDDCDDARVRGLVTAFTSATQFEVNGVPVEVAAGARVDGTVAAGVLVEVRGRAENGRIIASRVEVRSRSSDDQQEVELHGAMSSLDTAAKTFMLRGVKVNYAGVTEWRDGSESGLANDRQLEVKGRWDTADRSLLLASRIEFE